MVVSRAIQPNVRGTHHVCNYQIEEGRHRCRQSSSHAIGRLTMTILITAVGVSAALFAFRATRVFGVVGFLLTSYFFPLVDLVLAGILLAGMVLNVG